MNKVLVEFLGTLFFLYVIITTGNALAIGAALAAYHIYHGGERHVCTDFDGMSGAFLGPTFDQFEIETRFLIPLIKDFHRKKK